MREAPRPAAPTSDALILAEILLQPGHSMPPAESVQLGPVTSSKLQTLNLRDYGNELYISRGSFFAGSSTVNIHNLPNSNLSGLVLQRVDGEGTIMLKVSGQPILKTLGEGEQMYVQANRLVAVESSTQVLGQPNTLLINVVGPGKVLLQSLPSLETAMMAQAEATNQALQAGGVNNSMSSPFGGPMGMGGGLGSMLMQGAAFGVGSAIAHRAFDSAFGGSHAAAVDPATPAPDVPSQSHDDSLDSGDGGSSDGSFFGSMFGGDEGGDDGGDDGDW